MKRHYTLLLVPDAGEGGYTVTVPALPGCVTEGDTLEEAVSNAREAIQCHIEGLAQDGLPIPEEQTTPELVAIEI
ncbi:MAG: hypothetical protein JW395_2723 [Nitrospira sp.]|nr:hypothetical protein [Nitrospira sp.]